AGDGDPAGQLERRLDRLETLGVGDRDPGTEERRDGPVTFVGGDSIGLALGQTDETEAALRVGPGRDHGPGGPLPAVDSDPFDRLARRLRPDDASDWLARTDDVLECGANQERAGRLADEHQALAPPRWPRARLRRSLRRPGHGIKAAIRQHRTLDDQR